MSLETIELILPGLFKNNFPLLIIPNRTEHFSTLLVVLAGGFFKLKYVKLMLNFRFNQLVTTL